MTAAISVEHVWKEFRLGGSPATHLREALAGWWHRRDRTPPRLHQALCDVSFTAQPGEVVGLIGRNGAGKSTLLKLLSRITRPTRGRITLRGRVGSLLEVGTGFHPELSGRDNIYLSGAILGMSRADLRKRFDAIVAFAEIEPFLDTPVKRYSSGMYVRLAFAVAAHLEPDLLLVDEVLAVGDARFQKKCLATMEAKAHEGRTVLFVSHNLQATTRLCPRLILLADGRIVGDGPAAQIVGQYLGSTAGTTAQRAWPDPDTAPGNETARLRGVRLVADPGPGLEAVDIRRPVGIEIAFDVLTPGRVIVPNLELFNEEGLCVFVAGDVTSPWRDEPRPAGRHVATAWIPGNFLAEGRFVVGVALSTLDPVRVHAQCREAIGFQVVDGLAGDSARGDYAGPMPGVVRPLLRWEHAPPTALEAQFEYQAA
ncbi:MAG TPA: ABC transporter ATP-binding protein [Gemmatales bacterium]|nr:ABC transporter ATP-binding protein [Gemmatales bacterium]